MKLTQETTHVAAKDPNWSPVYERDFYNKNMGPFKGNPRSKQYKKKQEEYEQRVQDWERFKQEFPTTINTIGEKLAQLKQKYGAKLEVEPFEDNHNRGYYLTFYGEKIPPDLEGLPFEPYCEWNDDDYDLDWEGEGEAPHCFHGIINTHDRVKS
jgi:hypothetical protein